MHKPQFLFMGSLSLTVLCYCSFCSQLFSGRYVKLPFFLYVFWLLCAAAVPVSEFSWSLTMLCICCSACVLSFYSLQITSPMFYHSSVQWRFLYSFLSSSFFFVFCAACYFSSSFFSSSFFFLFVQLLFLFFFFSVFFFFFLQMCILIIWFVHLSLFCRAAGPRRRCVLSFFCPLHGCSLAFLHSWRSAALVFSPFLLQLQILFIRCSFTVLCRYLTSLQVFSLLQFCAAA